MHTRMITAAALAALAAVAVAAPPKRSAAYLKGLDADVLDAPRWPALMPAYDIAPKGAADVVDGAYFGGKLVYAPEDAQPCDARTFLLRKEFELKEKPVEAWLQFMADDSARAFLNGREASDRVQQWATPIMTNVTRRLTAGKNVIAFNYYNSAFAGGVLAELFVRYRDGSVERIDTDDGFKSHAGIVNGFSKVGFDDSGWKKVKTREPPPAAPWRKVIPYRDFANKLEFVGASLSTNLVEAGSKVRVKFEFRGKPPALPFNCETQFREGGAVYWTENRSFTVNEFQWTGDGTWKLDFEYETPMYCSARKPVLALDCGSLCLKDMGRVEVAVPFSPPGPLAGFAKPPRTSVMDVAGSPVFALDGRPFPAFWGGVVYSRRPDRSPNARRGPFNLITVHCGFREVWPRLGEFRPEALDRTAELYRRANRDGVYFMWDTTVYPPFGFAEANPDEMCVEEDGHPCNDGYHGVNFSFSSRKAIDLIKGMMTQAISHIENSPYANRVFGYRVNSGHTIEWLGWDPRKTGSHTVDFSPVTRKRFAEWAREHYPMLTDLTVPSVAERQALDGKDIVWDSAKHLKAIAYNDFYSTVIADDLIEMCTEAKRLVGCRKVIGTYHGYTMTLPASGCSQMRAHYALKKVLDSGAVDFLMSPHPYRVRNIGDACGDMKPFASIAANRVVSVIEDDTRTHLSGVGSGYFQPVNESQTQALLFRNYATYLCRNQPVYAYALPSGREFDFPAFTTNAVSLAVTQRHCVEAGVRRAAEVALVVSEETVKHSPWLRSGCFSGEKYQAYDVDGTVVETRFGGAPFWKDAMEVGYTRWAQSGAPVDYVLAEDLKDHPGDYKLYVFLDCFRYDDAFLAAVERLRSRRCTLMWTYAPGYTRGIGSSVANMEKLTGIRLARLDHPAIARATMADDGRKMGVTDLPLTPLFHVAQKCEVLGTYDSGETAVASVETGAATTIFSGPWRFDRKFIADVYRRAGVHVYTTSGDPMEANERLFVLHARFPGEKTVHLRKPADVLDVYNRRIMARGVDTFTFKTALHDTRFFYCGNDADALLAEIQSFGMADNSEYGLETTTTVQAPASIVTNAEGRVFVDFGKDAFGWLELLPPPGFTGGVYEAMITEARLPGDMCDSWAGGTIRADWTFPIELNAGTRVFRPPMRRDERNTNFARPVPPVKLRPEVGNIMPFRYVEFYSAPFEITPKTIRRVMVHYPIDMGESSFSCSDRRLVDVYDFCKYSILATSFAGLYVDGDRERVPYEADAYINQLGNYAISSDLRLARASHEYLMRHPTWPSEWKQHSVKMAWADWMWSGDASSARKCYDALKSEKMLSHRVRPDGLLSSPPQALSGETRYCDLIDWPPRDRDKYVYSKSSAVINAFRYCNLREMSDLARATGRAGDAADFDAQAAKVLESYNRVFFDPSRGLYRDGEGVDHHGLHANALALAFGLAPESRRRAIADYLASRGMACSVYFAQYLLEALYAGGRADAALALMTASGDRSWLGMMEQGSTITMEAWSLPDKPNLDWNHAWGSPPLNIIARFVLGVTPAEPGFAKVRIAPQPAGLRSVKGVVPTIRGGVSVEVDGDALTVETPVPAQVEWRGRAYSVDKGCHKFG